MLLSIVLHPDHFLLAAVLLIPIIAGSVRATDEYVNDGGMQLPPRRDDLAPVFFNTSAYPWQAPDEGDGRSPCAFLNTLANHGCINRNGTFIDVFDIVTQMEEVFGFSPEYIYRTKIIPAIECGQTYEDRTGTLRLDLHGLFAPICKDFRSILVRSPDDITAVNQTLLDNLLATDKTRDISEKMDQDTTSDNILDNRSVLTLEDISLFHLDRIFEVYDTTYDNPTFEIAGSDFMTFETLSLILLGSKPESGTVEKDRLSTFLVWERLPDQLLRSTHDFFDTHDSFYIFFLDVYLSLEDALKITFHDYGASHSQENSTLKTSENNDKNGSNDENKTLPDDLFSLNSTFFDGAEPHFNDHGLVLNDTAQFEDEVTQFDEAWHHFDGGLQFDDAWYSFDDSLQFDDSRHNFDEIFQFDDAWYNFDDSLQFDDAWHNFDDSLPIDDAWHNFDDSLPIDDAWHNFDDSLPVDDTWHNFDDSLPVDDAWYNFENPIPPLTGDSMNFTIDNDTSLIDGDISLIDDSMVFDDAVSFIGDSIPPLIDNSKNVTIDDDTSFIDNNISLLDDAMAFDDCFLVDDDGDIHTIDDENTALVDNNTSLLNDTMVFVDNFSVDDDSNVSTIDDDDNDDLSLVGNSTSLLDDAMIFDENFPLDDGDTFSIDDASFLVIKNTSLLDDVMIFDDNLSVDDDGDTFTIDDVSFFVDHNTSSPDDTMIFENNFSVYDGFSEGEKDSDEIVSPFPSPIISDSPLALLSGQSSVPSETLMTSPTGILPPVDVDVSSSPSDTDYANYSVDTYMPTDGIEMTAPNSTGISVEPTTVISAEEVIVSNISTTTAPENVTGAFFPAELTDYTSSETPTPTGFLTSHPFRDSPSQITTSTPSRLSTEISLVISSTHTPSVKSITFVVPTDSVSTDISDDPSMAISNSPTPIDSNSIYFSVGPSNADSSTDSETPFPTYVSSMSIVSESPMAVSGATSPAAAIPIDISIKPPSTVSSALSDTKDPIGAIYGNISMEPISTTAFTESSTHVPTDTISAIILVGSPPTVPSTAFDGLIPTYTGSSTELAPIPISAQPSTPTPTDATSIYVSNKKPATVSSPESFLKNVPVDIATGDFPNESSPTLPTDAISVNYSIEPSASIPFTETESRTLH